MLFTSFLAQLLQAIYNDLVPNTAVTDITGMCGCGVCHDETHGCWNGNFKKLIIVFVIVSG